MIEEHPRDYSKLKALLFVALIIVVSVAGFFVLFDGILFNVPPVNATTKPVESVAVSMHLMPNELVAESDDYNYFRGFTSSACYYAGKTHIVDSGNCANFNVIGYNTYGGSVAVYSFSVKNAETFYMYGKIYRVSLGNMDSLVTLTTPTS